MNAAREHTQRELTNRFQGDARIDQVSKLYRRGRAREARELLRQLTRDTWPGDSAELALAHRSSLIPRPRPSRLAKLARLYRDPHHLAEIVNVSVRLIQRACADSQRKERRT